MSSGYISQEKVLIIKSKLILFFLQLEHGKKYSNDVEESFRMKIFTENKHKIASHNKLFSTGVKSYKLRMNKYGDMVSWLPVARQ